LRVNFGCTEQIVLCLVRLYEVQVKKIVKVQSMMRAFLAKKKVNTPETKAPGSLADTDTSNGKLHRQPSLAVTEPLSRFREPLDSIFDYLEDPPETEEAGADDVF